VLSVGSANPEGWHRCRKQTQTFHLFFGDAGSVVNQRRESNGPPNLPRIPLVPAPPKNKKQFHLSRYYKYATPGVLNQLNLPGKTLGSFPSLA
jgi:hypothetical protein